MNAIDTVLTKTKKHKLEILKQAGWAESNFRYWVWHKDHNNGAAVPLHEAWRRHTTMDLLRDIARLVERACEDD